MIKSQSAWFNKSIQQLAVIVTNQSRCWERRDPSATILLSASISKFGEDLIRNDRVIAIKRQDIAISTA